MNDNRSIEAFLGIGSVLILVAILFSCFVENVHGEGAWTTQTIDKNAAIGSIIAIDNTDNPHVAYSDYENGDITKNIYAMYASWNGTGWAIQSLNQTGRCLDFKLDSDNNPHILIRALTGLMYAHLIESQWSIQTIDNQSFSGVLALDSAENPHVAYIANGTTFALKYASLTKSGWNIQTVDSNLTSIYYATISLALDRNDIPHITYQGYPASIKYAVLNQSSWDIQVVLEDAVLHKMVIDSNGNPSFLYESHVPFMINNTLAYESWNGSTWNTQTVISNTSIDGRSVTLDARNYPHIDYFIGRRGEGRLIYTRWTGTAWNTQTVDSVYASGSGPIALDSRGNPHICYSGAPYGITDRADLMYATFTDSSTFEFALLAWIAIPALIASILVAFAYLWRKKHPKQS